MALRRCRKWVHGVGLAHVHLAIFGSRFGSLSLSFAPSGRLMSSFLTVWVPGITLASCYSFSLRQS